MSADGEHAAIRQMWQGGPLRNWSESKTALTPIRHVEGFVGSYACSSCRKTCNGVYRVREDFSWLCGPCKEMSKRRSEDHRKDGGVPRMATGGRGDRAPALKRYREKVSLFPVASARAAP